MRRTWLPLLPVALAAVAMGVYGPIAQPADYHAFADRRTFLGIPYALDVLSNLAFLAVGMHAIGSLRDEGRGDAVPRARPGWWLFAFSLVLTAFGSAWYHLAPDDSRLAWDRLPIALACAGLLAAMHARTHEVRHPGPVAAVLALLAAGSVAWWAGTADLRPYLLVQGAPLVVVPLWQWAARSPMNERLAYGAAVALYALAKVAEINDAALLEALVVVSGHTLKHLLAAAAAAVLVVVQRQAAASAAA